MSSTESKANAEPVVAVWESVTDELHDLLPAMLAKLSPPMREDPQL